MMELIKVYAAITVVIAMLFPTAIEKLGPEWECQAAGYAARGLGWLGDGTVKIVNVSFFGTSPSLYFPADKCRQLR